jgi:hypothetical protein
VLDAPTGDSDETRIFLDENPANWSQQQSETTKAHTHKHPKGSDHGMMMECHQNMQSIRQSNDKLKATINKAKQSNDPAKMRSALDDAEKSIDSMNGRMDKCMSMMKHAGYAWQGHDESCRGHEGHVGCLPKPSTAPTPK